MRTAKEEQTKEHLFKIIKKKYIEYGRKLDSLEILNDKEMPSYYIVKKVFGKTYKEVWQDVEKEMGIPQKKKNCTIKEAKETILEKMKELGREPERYDLDYRTFNCLKNNFGSYTEGLIALNIRKRSGEKWKKGKRR